MLLRLMGQGNLNAKSRAINLTTVPHVTLNATLTNINGSLALCLVSKG